MQYDDDDNKSIWPTLAVSALCRRARRIHIDRVCFHTIPPSLRIWNILVKGRKHTVVSRHIPPGVKEHHIILIWAT